jgi:hypothetical protein
MNKNKGNKMENDKYKQYLKPEILKTIDYLNNLNNNYDSLDCSQLNKMFKIKGYKNKRKLKFISKFDENVYFVCEWSKDDNYDFNIDFHKSKICLKNCSDLLLVNNHNLYMFFDDIIDLNVNFLSEENLKMLNNSIV